MADQMGFSITWCAVREEHAEEFLSSLGLSPTGVMEEIPEALISSARLDTGWRVLWYGDYSCPFLRPEEDSEHLSDRHFVVLDRTQPPKGWLARLLG
jgi:hypothetical protein